MTKITLLWYFGNMKMLVKKEMLLREEGLTEEQVEERARENVFYIADTFTDFFK